ncbi:NAD-dependent epimerase/dehydratase family protein [Tessaracoccus sp. OS52]|uniref:NAD-dependent epimerase/dehydratase family protein n=1 Tax=Tessaracoccus sp. OS52 TaxID=2886691 RepID=UPI001D12A157|nr:NAD-dependent epimerase/dehydratase family protein [Tessaracoccus sp. OS52]MCC2593456.1 NAD-dependent epimerase/dehydratase family protein [Tessaracoccus sp. OS52]
MSWSRTQEHHFDLPAEQLWQIIGDPSRLPCWSPAVSRLPETVDRNAAERTITCRSPLVGGTLLVSWTLSGSGDGTLLTQRVTVQGPYPSLAAGRLARPHVSGFAENCARLFTQSGGAPNAPKVVIAGGSGFLGRQLAADLACRGHEVVVLTRRSDPALSFRQSVWDGRTVGAWASELTGDGTALVNLAGKLVDCPPTQANIADLRSSRVDATRALVEASKGLRAPLARWLQASTTAIFGDAGEARLTEHSAIPASPREGALPQMTGVAQPWEAAVEGANAAHVTILRTSIVLEQDCPAFERLALLANSGLGGPVGGGEQWFSWIHLADWLRIARGALGSRPASISRPGWCARPHPRQCETGN